MDSKILAELKSLTDKFYKFESKMNEIERKMDDLYRELGTKQGYEMYRQVDEIQQEQKRFIQKINQIERDVTAIRKTTEFGDVDIKEIKQALALIYRNTDELETHLIGEARQTY
ncbi:MAG TPA: hypothetical protein VGA67_02145 [Candidatus Dojkabacteria bacterium]